MKANRMTKTEVCKTYRLTPYATSIKYYGKALMIFYHNTAIATIREDAIKINNGGYFTQTTKKRINLILDHYNLPFRLYQIKKQWYLIDSRTNTNYLFKRQAWIKLNNHKLVELI